MVIELFNMTRDELIQKIRQQEEQITVLQEDVAFLRALEMEGVDNWSGYEFAQERMDEME